MKIATTPTLATIVDQNGQQQPIFATLECLEGRSLWVLRIGTDDADAQTGAHETLRDCLKTAIDSWQFGDWQFETTDEGAEILDY